MMTVANHFARRTAGVAAALIAVALAAPAVAQTAQPAKPAAPAAKPAAGAPAKPAAPVAQAAPAPAQAAPAQPEIQITATPWVKVCQEVAEIKKQVCMISQTVTLENQQPLVRLDLTDVQGEPKKVLRLILPMGMRLQPGIRLTIDQQPNNYPYSICLMTPEGAPICAIETEVDADLVNKLKKGNQVVIQAIAGNGRPWNVPLNMKDFAKVFDGPGMDPKVLAEAEKQRVDAARKAREARGQQDQQLQSAVEKMAQERRGQAGAPAPANGQPPK